jgi:hypothetical protein
LAATGDHNAGGEPRKPKTVSRPASTGPARKPKRELPPYLRVIK